MTIDKARRKQLVARWHRRLAVFISLWLVVLATSGFFINHAHDFQLDSKPVPSTLQRAIYGIESGIHDSCTPATDPLIDCGGIFARIPTGNGALLFDQDNLYLVDSQGRLIEKLGAGQFGLGRLDAVLGKGTEIYLRDSLQTVRTNTEILDWKVLDDAAKTTIAGDMWQQRDIDEVSVSWERLLLDLHAARFLGPFAKWFNDLMVVLILFIAISGIRLFRLKRNGNSS